MTPRALPDPLPPSPALVVCLVAASVAAFFAAGAAVTSYALRKLFPKG